jgi:hypothetical protein
MNGVYNYIMWSQAGLQGAREDFIAGRREGDWFAKLGSMASVSKTSQLFQEGGIKFRLYSKYFLASKTEKYLYFYL